MASQNTTASPDTPVNIKISIAGKEDHRKFRLTLKDLGANTFPEKVGLTSTRCSLITAILFSCKVDTNLCLYLASSTPSC